MLPFYKYTEKEKKELLKQMGILVDSREKKNEHITKTFDKMGILYKTQKLDQGDYSFFLPVCEELNIDRELCFDKHIVLERKNSAEEISGNLTRGRKEFKHELASFKGDLMQLIIEGTTYNDIKKGNYSTEYGADSFIASLHSISTEFDVPFIFLDKEDTGEYIYKTCYYYLRNIIK